MSIFGGKYTTREKKKTISSDMVSLSVKTAHFSADYKWTKKKKEFG